jgi:hypothetical protein
MPVLARPHASLGRRGLLLGGLGLLTTACSDGSSGASPSKPTSSGPIIHEQDAGNVISTADLDELASRLNQALRDADVQAMKEVAPTIRVAEWERRLENIARFPMSEVGFEFDQTYDRQVNASGGPLQIEAHFALTHQISDVDSRPVVQVYWVDLEKRTPDSPVRITSLEGPHDDSSPAPWDLADDWEVLTGDHVVLVARPTDAARARASLASIDAGVARAMDVIAPPDGVTKAFVALADASTPLYRDGETTSISEYAGVAFRAGYVDPQEAARSGKGAGRNAPYASSRILLLPAAFGSASGLEDVAMHETIHAMASQWGIGDPWPAEGLARWAEAGFAAGLRSSPTYAPSIRSGFAGFAQRMRGVGGIDYDVFHDPDTEAANYNCAAAVYGYVESRGGREAVLEFGRKVYSETVVDAAKVIGEPSQAALFGKVQQWVQSW